MKASIQKPGTSLGSWDLITQREPEPLLNDAELADYLKICRRSLHTLRASGRIPFIKIGKSVRFRRSDVERMLDAMTSHGNGSEGES